MTVRYRTSLYRHFLTPALHRRFTRAAVVALAVCYVTAVIIGEKSSWLWWFPAGRTGIRTLLLFISTLAVFVLRVAQLRLDARNTVSHFETFRKDFFRFNTIQTVSWYLFSAWWFSEVYVWSAPADVNLGWIVEGKSWEKKRLNERPIYLRSVFFMLALLQAFSHLFYDYDRLFRPFESRKVEIPKQRSYFVVAPVEQLKTTAVALAQRAAMRSLLVGITGPFIYAIFIRRTAWSWAMSVAKILWDMPAAAELSYLPPYHITLIFRSLVSSFMLSFLWESSNAIFSAFVAQEPLKNGQPLTYESRDPNGSLLNGLQARKDIIKTFALWELVYISQCFEDRRILIFADIDRTSGPAWTQIALVCLATINDITNRIQEFQNPSLKHLPPLQQNSLQSLPRLAAPLRQDEVFSNSNPPRSRREKIESNIGTFAKSYGQSPPSQLPGPFTPRAKQYIGAARSKLLTQGQQQIISPSNLRASFNDYLLRFIRSPFGSPFRQTFERRIRTVVLGSPYSQFGQILDAIDALSYLVVSSLKEDRYGKVSKDVAQILRTYSDTITKLESFVDTMTVHWTDVGFQSRNVEEMDLILAGLKEGLGAMIQGFGKYASELGIAGQELRAMLVIAGIEEEPTLGR